MKPEIIVEIHEKGGGLSFEVVGESGRRCLEATEFLEHAIGETVSRKFKADYLMERSQVKSRLKARSRNNE